MSLKAARISKANLTESCYFNIVLGEYVRYESQTALGVAAIGLFKHSPDIPTSILQVRVFWFYFHVSSFTLRCPYAVVSQSGMMETSFA